MKRFFALLFLICWGCSDVSETVQNTASADHDCPTSQVGIKSKKEIPCGFGCYPDYIYDLNVCGVARKYRANRTQRSWIFTEIKD